jgi:hypothetical protein
VAIVDSIANVSWLLIHIRFYHLSKALFAHRSRYQGILFLNVREAAVARGKMHLSFPERPIALLSVGTFMKKLLHFGK